MTTRIKAKKFRFLKEKQVAIVTGMRGNGNW